MYRDMAVAMPFVLAIAMAGVFSRRPRDFSEAEGFLGGRAEPSRVKGEESTRGCPKMDFVLILLVSLLRDPFRIDSVGSFITGSISD